MESHVGELRRVCGDRAVLRALHYYDENARVLEQAAAIRGGDLPAFFDAVKRSGDSSWKLLQNVYARSTEEQMAMGIELSRPFPARRRRAARTRRRFRRNDSGLCAA